MDQLRALLANLRPVPGLGLISGGLLLVAAYAAVLAWAMDTQTYSVWGGLLVIPWVIAANALLIWRAARQEGAPWFGWILAFGYLAKLIGITARYAVAYVVYDGVADASRYNGYAAAHYRLWRQGAFVWELGGSTGTKNLEIITTAVYTLTGPTPFAGFVVFGSMAFWGCYFLYRAFRTAVPQGNAKRYALLLFFLPSLIYWPASIGKESWLLLFVGLAAFGAARFFVGGPHWQSLLAVGGVGIALIRPHVAVLLFGSLVAAQLFRPVSTHRLGVLSKGAGLLVLMAAALVLTTQSADFLGIEDLSAQGVLEEMQVASDRTLMGGSAFTPLPLTHPLGVPSAVLTLLVRPFPWEAGNLQMLVQSMEGLGVAALVVMSFPRWGHLWRTLWRQPFVVLCLTYVLAYILAFSQFGNFGIVARQRVLMIPFFLVFLALPTLSQLRASPGRETKEVGSERARPVA